MPIWRSNRMRMRRSHSQRYPVGRTRIPCRKDEDTWGTDEDTLTEGRGYHGGMAKIPVGMTKIPVGRMKIPGGMTKIPVGMTRIPWRKDMGDTFFRAGM